MNLLSASANRLSACGRTLLPAAVLDPSGQASPAEGQPCRTAGARFTAIRRLGWGSSLAPLAAGGQLVGLCGKARRDEPGRRVRYNIMAIAKGYSCASRGVFF